MILVIDNYDSFVYNLVRQLHEAGADTAVYRAGTLSPEAAVAMQPSGLLLSPGPKSPEEAGASLAMLDTFAGKIPVLGVCLGHQCIAHFFGGRVCHGQQPVHGKISEVMHLGTGVFEGIPQGTPVTRYHSLRVDPELLPGVLEVTARTRDGVIMGLRHRQMDIEGVQFHPEAVLTRDGDAMIRNFVNRCRGVNI